MICHELRLTFPDAGCPGRIAGPFCVHPAKPPMGESLERHLVKAFGLHHVDEFWIRIRVPSPPVTKKETTKSVSSPSWSVFFWVIVYFLAPLLLGFLTGLLFSRLLRRTASSRWSAVVLGLSPLLAVTMLSPKIHVGYPDLLLLAVLAGIGILFGSHERAKSLERRSIALALGSFVLALFLLEISLRLILPPPPAFPRARDIQLVPSLFSRNDHDSWSALHPERYPFRFALRVAKARQARTVFLHVGDSMVHGSHVNPSLRFTALLNLWQKKIYHLNAGILGTGPDFQYLLIRRWSALVRMRRVLHHVYLGNDLLEMDRAYVVCRDSPLLEYTEKGIRPRCSRPEWGSTGARPLLTGLPPYPLRVATSFSFAARHLCAIFWRFSRRLKDRFDVKTAWPHFASVITATAEHLKKLGVGYTVVLLPPRDHLSRKTTTRERMFRDRTLALCRKLGIEHLDAHPILEPLVRKHGSGRYFIDDPPGDVHFNPRGHEVIARWLMKELEHVTETE